MHEPSAGDYNRQKAKIKGLFKNSCRQDRDLNSCHKLAEFYESVDKRFDKAIRLYETNCAAGLGRSCMNLAVLHYLGASIPVDKDKATKLFELGCRHGHYESCIKGAAVHAGHIDRKLGYGVPLTETEATYAEKAFGMLEFACGNNSPRGCLTASSAYILGYGRSQLQNIEKAREYACKACDLGEIPGCVNAARMYTKGDGGEINPAMADFYRKMAHQLDAANKKK